MGTAETWTEPASLEGYASAVVIVIGLQEYPAMNRYEIRLECLALDTYLAPIAVAMYLWGERAGSDTRAFKETFDIGSCWRVSGRIDCGDGYISFLDPVYMPFDGKACEVLRRHASAASDASSS